MMDSLNIHPEERPKSPHLASSLAMSTVPTEARDDAAHQVPPDAAPALRLVADESSHESAPALDEIDKVVLVQLMCAVASLKTEVRALRRRVSFLEGATPV
jgi:hypothetical protein